MLGHFLRESSVEQDQGKLDTRPGKRLHNYMENHHFIAGKTDYSMAMFNSFLYVYQKLFSMMR